MMFGKASFNVNRGYLLYYAAVFLFLIPYYSEVLPLLSLLIFAILFGIPPLKLFLKAVFNFRYVFRYKHERLYLIPAFTLIILLLVISGSIIKYTYVESNKKFHKQNKPIYNYIENIKKDYL